MTKEEKREAFDSWEIDKLNQAKDLMASASDYLTEKGLYKDAEQLMKMVFKLEAFQNKYNY